MTTDPHDEHGEILRRALHAEAETVIPEGDGLEKIRTRIDERARRRFAWDWLTVNWARPMAAVAAAVAVTFIGVTAPQAIEFIQSTGSHGPFGADGGSAEGNRATQGLPPNAQPTTPPQASGSGAPVPPGSPTPSASPGAENCAPPPVAVASPTPSPSPSPAGSGEPQAPSSQPCPSGAPTAEPSPSPSGPEPTAPVTTEPTNPPVTGGDQTVPPQEPPTP